MHTYIHTEITTLYTYIDVNEYTRWSLTLHFVKFYKYSVEKSPRTQNNQNWGKLQYLDIIDLW